MNEPKEYIENWDADEQPEQAKSPNQAEWLRDEEEERFPWNEHHFGQEDF